MYSSWKVHGYRFLHIPNVNCNVHTLIQLVCCIYIVDAPLAVVHRTYAETMREYGIEQLLCRRKEHLLMNMFAQKNNLEYVDTGRPGICY